MSIYLIIYLQFSVILPESNEIKIGICCFLILAYIILKATGVIGKKNEIFEWKESHTGTSARRQSTNDIFSGLKERHRRPSEEALFSSGMFNIYFGLNSLILQERQSLISVL